MKILNLFGLYTKGQYFEGLFKAKVHGHQQGKKIERGEASGQLLAAQLRIDSKNVEIKQLKKQIGENELEIQYLESELINTHDKKIHRLELLRKRVKSYKKINKITNRINQLELKRDEFKGV